VINKKAFTKKEPSGCPAVLSIQKNFDNAIVHDSPLGKKLGFDHPSKPLFSLVASLLL
jgi:hypothetical protein